MITVDPIADTLPPEEFVEKTRHALENLSNLRVLNRHPLARLFAQDVPTTELGQHLRQELIAAIESLKPDDSNERENAIRYSRMYDLLHLYYVNGIKLQQVANRLGISPRQTYRDLKAACQEVSEIIWFNHCLSTPVRTHDCPRGCVNADSTPTDVYLLLDEAMQTIQTLMAHQHTYPLNDAPPTVVIPCQNYGVVQQLFLSLFRYVSESSDTRKKLVASLTQDGQRWMFSLSYQ